MNFAVKAEQRSYISVFVLVGKTSVRIKDLLKQTECLRTVLKNLLYRWPDRFTVKLLVHSEI